MQAIAQLKVMSPTHPIYLRPQKKMLKICAKNIIYSVGRRFGYTIIPNWRLTTFHQAIYLRRLFDLCHINTVIDAGANEGQYRDFLRAEVGYSGEIISIEPIPQLVDRLQKRAASDPNWRIEACALSSKVGTAVLNVMQQNQFSSLLTPDHSETNLFSQANSIERTIEVETKTLDLLIAGIAQRQNRNIYLKLDTQGFDLEVLKGAPNSLSTIVALQTEASFKRIYRGAPDYGNAIDFLREHNFEISAVHPNNEGHFPALVELDFHFVNKKLVPLP